jgi:hypothetical protein
MFLMLTDSCACYFALVVVEILVEVVALTLFSVEVDVLIVDTGVLVVATLVVDG